MKRLVAYLKKKFGDCVFGHDYEIVEYGMTDCISQCKKCGNLTTFY